MKILLVSPLPPPAGGIASWTRQYIDWCNKNSIKVDIVNISVIGSRKNRIKSKRRIYDEVKRTVIIFLNLGKKLKSDRPDVVHLNTSCSKIGIIRDYFCAKIVKFFNVKLVVHYRCNIEDQIGLNKITHFFLTNLSKDADINIVLNRFSKEFLFKTIKIEPILIPNFIDESFVLENKEINKEIKIISFVGHVQKEKGVMEIIEVAKSLPNIEIKLAGPVSEEIRLKSSSPNIEFLNEISKEKVRSLLMESDIFLFPSHTEGFANAMLEAMSLGLPIIATDVGANKDMIGEQGGVIVEKFSINEIIEGIRNLEEPKIRQRASKYNINRVKKNYTTDKVIRELLELYRKMV